MNTIETKRALVDRLFKLLNRDYRECTIYTPGIESIVPGANGVLIKRIEHYNYKTGNSSWRYKLHVVDITGGESHEWEKEIAKFESLAPATRDKLVDMLNTKCDNAPAPFGVWYDMPTTLIGMAHYFTL